MKIAAARALASLVPPDELADQHIIPGIFHPDVAGNVPAAAKAAEASGAT